MALWDLIAAGVESTMRGTINWLVRQGARLLDATTASRAADHVINLMSVRDVEDSTHIRRIATEQQQAISVAQQIQRGQIVGNLSQIPVSSTFSAVGDDRVRYLVIVPVRDGQTGEQTRIPIEILSDVPILASDVRSIAVDRVQRMDIANSYRNTIGDVGRVTIGGPVIISVTRAG
jgi:hypothetical protein